MQKYRARSLWRHEILIVFVVAVLFWLFELVGWAASVRGGIERVFTPVLSAQTELVQRARAPVAALATGWVRQSELRDLERAYARALSQLSQLQYVQEENEALRLLLEESERTSTGGTSTIGTGGSRVISAPLASLATPVIASGAQHGVTPGAMVSSQGVLLGIVAQVFEHQSTVALLSQPAAGMLLVETQGGARGLLAGDGRRILLKEVPLDQPLVVGERISTLGQEGIQRGVFVGVVQSIISDLADPVQTAVINQHVSFYTEAVVEVW